MDKRLSTVGIDITNCCNLNCVHCYKGEIECVKHMPTNEIEYILDKVIDYNPLYLVLSGGEPFLHPQIEDILNLIGKKYPNDIFYIACNGTAISKQHIELLQKYNNIHIQISLDGARKETHEAQHGKGTFEKVMLTLSTLCSLIGNRVSIQMTISKINYLDVVEVANIAKDLNIRPKFQHICMVGNAKKNKQMLEMTPFQKAMTFVNLNNFSKQHPEMNIIAPKSLLSCSFADEETPISLNIDPYGDIITCTCFDKKDYCIGNIFENEIEEIINSPTIQLLKSKVLHRIELLSNGICKDCFVNFRCEQGCIGRAIELGNENGLDGECEFRKALFILNRGLKAIKNGL